MSARRARHIWTAEEEALLCRAYADMPTSELAARLSLGVMQVFRKASKMGLKKSARYKRSAHFPGFKPGNQKGRETRFKKGNTPFNKGKKFNAGGRSVKTRLKVGHVPHNTVPVGQVVTDSHGYFKQKIANNGDQGDWRLLHHLVWEGAHGPAPAGHIIVFKDGDQQNVQLDNLACISRAENMQKNSIHRYPDALKKAIRQVAKLNQTIEEKQS